MEGPDEKRPGLGALLNGHTRSIIQAAAVFGLVGAGGSYWVDTLRREIDTLRAELQDDLRQHAATDARVEGDLAAAIVDLREELRRMRREGMTREQARDLQARIERLERTWFGGGAP